jgi:hypothetical protein
MDTIELKSNFHELIDNIKNDTLLVRFYDIMLKANNIREGSLLSRLTKEEYHELMLAYQESDSAMNTISHKEMKKKHQKWL